MGNIVEYSMDDFKIWLKNADLTEEAQVGVTEEPVAPHDDWRNNLIKARVYAKSLGVTDRFKGDWSKLDDIVAAIDEALGETKKAPKPKRKKKVTEKIEATVEGTGETVTMERDAMEAWQMTGTKIEAYNNLLECMG
jgi:hypothetical protein